MKKESIIALSLILTTLTSLAQFQYIDEVLEYTPAPGQHINTVPWGMPESAESIVGTLNGSLTLGAWGGNVVFRFEDPVPNHADNPFGIDFIIFGNPTATWAEPASVWVMQDKNQNGLPDDLWYQLAGSDYFFSSTQHNYEVTYFNPQTDIAANVPWEDNLDNSGVINANSFHTHNYYPRHDFFPHIPHEQYTLAGSRILGATDKTNTAFIKSFPRAFGYADNTPRKTMPFNVPDNPYTQEIENAGGDVFDISWAVDEEGNYVELDEVHFIKVQTAMLDDGGWLGEVSAEITGAVVVEPNSSITGILDKVVVKDLPLIIDQSPYPLEAFAFHKGRWQSDRTILWSSDLEGAYVDDDSLHFNASGELTLTAYLEDSPDILTTATTTLEYHPTHVRHIEKESFKVFPIPATGFIHIETTRQTHIKLCDLQGKTLKEFNHPGGLQTLSLENLKPGMYLLIHTNAQGTSHKKIIVR